MEDQGQTAKNVAELEKNVTAKNMPVTNLQRKLIEERVEEVPFDGKSTLRSILTRLFSYAQPGNWAAFELEDKWGFIQDYREFDWGNTL